MILFKSDIANYPTAIADNLTTNESWVYLAGLYKSMSVANYFFHLMLHNPTLQGVDPHSNNLTAEQKTAIAVECKFNPFYFFREVLRLPDGAYTLKYRANRANMALIWSFLCGIDFANIMIRQTGKSTGSDGILIYLLLFYFENTEMMFITKDSDARAVIIARLKKIIKLLPEWLNPMTKYDLDNTEALSCKSKGNLLSGFIGQRQLFLAKAMGRGSYCPVVVGDEGPFTPNIQYSLPAVIAATAAARENAEARGALYGNIYTTTTGSLDENEGRYMYNFVYSGMYWNEKILDFNSKEEAREYVRINSPKGRTLINGTFSHRQVGKTDEWLRNRVLLADSTRDELDRDYFNKWTSGKMEGAISKVLMQIIRDSVVEPKHSQITKDKYLYKWYIPVHEINTRLSRGHYILSLDSSQAVGRDANGLTLTDVRDLSVVMASDVSEASLHKYALSIANFLISFENVTFVIENKGSGQAIIDTVTSVLVASGINPFKRIYNKVVERYLEEPEDYAEINKSTFKNIEGNYIQWKKLFGFSTDRKSRLFLYDTVLNDAVKSSGHLIRDQGLADELGGLIIKNNRVDHINGGHDDLVISYLLAHWFIKHSKNLQYYGINPRDCLSLVTHDGATVSAEELVKRQRYTELLSEIDDLKNQLTTKAGIMENLCNERLLENKIKQLNLLGNTTISVDSILEEIKRSKVSKNSLVQALAKHNHTKTFMR